MQTGIWALVSLHLPGRSIEPVGIILSDDADQLHVKFRNDWSSIANEEETEICRELAEDLGQKGHELGAANVLDWLENTASHAIQLGTRTTVRVPDVNIALQALYQQHVDAAEHKDKPNAAHTRYRVHVAMAAALFITGVLGTQWNRFHFTSKSFSYASVNPSLLSQLPRRPDLPLDVGSVSNPAFVSHHHHRPRRMTPHAHRVFQFQNIPFKAPAEQAIQIDAPPSYDVTELNSPSLLDFSLPEPPPFQQIRHNRFVHFFAVVASSVKKLFSSQPADEGILN